MFDVIYPLADIDTVLESHKDCGIGMVTSRIRIEGCPVGMVANHPMAQPMQIG